MTTPAQTDRSVNRLHDIVVEEVSLVDRVPSRERLSAEGTLISRLVITSRRRVSGTRGATDFTSA